MRTAKIFFAIGIAICVFGCQNGNNQKSENASASDTASAITSSIAAIENSKDSAHKFVRTADFKCKVTDVVKSTYNIEDITGKQGGFVTYTNLASNIDNRNTIAISADSSLETTYYTVTNSIVLRVPNTKLDTTLKQIAANIDYLDYRVIKAEDVALQMLSNKLAEKRNAGNEKRLTNDIDGKGKKLPGIMNAEEALLNNQTAADNSKIAGLSLADQVKYSTVSIALYQRQAVKRELVSNEKNITVYEQSFGSKLLDSFMFGWEMMSGIFIFLAKFWALFLFILLAYFIYKRYGSKLIKQ